MMKRTDNVKRVDEGENCFNRLLFIFVCSRTLKGLISLEPIKLIL